MYSVFFLSVSKVSTKRRWHLSCYFVHHQIWRNTAVPLLLPCITQVSFPKHGFPPLLTKKKKKKDYTIACDTNVNFLITPPTTFTPVLFPVVSGGKGSGQLLSKSVAISTLWKEDEGNWSQQIRLYDLSELPGETARIFSLVTASSATEVYCVCYPGKHSVCVGIRLKPPWLAAYKQQLTSSGGIHLRCP